MKKHGYMYFGRFRVLFSLALKGFLPDFRYIPRFVGFIFSSLFTLPLKIFESSLVNRKIRKHRVKEDPIFILGHMRSGTTHLHNLLGQDERYAYPTTFAAYCPEFYIYGKNILKPLFKYFVPKNRPMDSMEVSIEYPQEEEFAVCAITEHSFFYHMLFPRKTEYFFSRYVIYEGIDEHSFEKWKKSYEWVIRKFSYTAGNKRLILKNPVNTGRSKILSELYPEASFIHIKRDPYSVFVSTRNLYRKVMPLCQLQKVDWAEVEVTILKNYTRQMKAYYRDKELLDQKQLIEINYEELEKDPIPVLNSVYAHLQLKDFEQVRSRMLDYLSTLEEYQKNKFSLDQKDVDLVNTHCSEIFELTGYPMIKTIDQQSS